MSVGLEIIQENAFENCENLQIIDFSHNNLSFIDVGTFKSNVKLKNLGLYFNKFKMFDMKNLNRLSNLEVLGIGSNPLQEFLVSESDTKEKLHSLSLGENDFIDLDVEGILQKCPTLNFFSILPCKLIPDERFDTIVFQILSKNIILASEYD